MAQIIKLKRGTTTPTNTDIVNGEVAIDTSAKKLYINDGGTVKEIGGGSSATSGAGAPSSTPSAVGDIYIDTTNDVAYIATDTVSSSDWKVFTGLIGATEATGSVTLTNTSNPMQAINPQGFDKFITLPDATTMTEAPVNFVIKNRGYWDYGIKDNSGTILGYIRGGEAAMVSLVDNATAAGEWSTINAEPVGFASYKDGLAINATLWGNGGSHPDRMLWVEFATDKYLFTFSEDNGTGVYGIVYDGATQTWGNMVTIHSGFAPGIDRDLAVVSTSEVVFAYYSASGTISARVLSISGTTITVNTAAGWSATASANQFFQMQKFGSTYVVAYRDTSQQYNINAFTISGTTVSWGTGQVVASSTNHVGFEMYSDGSSGIFVVSEYNAATNDLQIQHYSISGTTLTAGTAANITGLTAKWVSCSLSGTNNVAIIAQDDSNNYDGYIVSHSAGVVSVSSSLNFMTVMTAPYLGLVPKSDRVIVVSNSGTAFRARVLIDSSGTATAGTLFQDLVNGGSSGGGPLFLDEANGALYYQNLYSATLISSTASRTNVVFRVTESGGTVNVESRGVIGDPVYTEGYYTTAVDRGPRFFGGSTWPNNGDYKKCFWYLFGSDKFGTHLGDGSTGYSSLIPPWYIDKESGAVHKSAKAVASPAREGSIPPMMIETGAHRQNWGKGKIFTANWPGGVADASAMFYRMG